MKRRAPGAADPNASSVSRRDFDRYDAFCDHLLVVDLELVAERPEHHARAEQHERGGQQRVQVVQGRESILVSG